MSFKPTPFLVQTSQITSVLSWQSAKSKTAGGTAVPALGESRQPPNKGWSLDLKNTTFWLTSDQPTPPKTSLQWVFERLLLKWNFNSLMGFHDPKKNVQNHKDKLPSNSERLKAAMELQFPEGIPCSFRWFDRWTKAAACVFRGEKKRLQSKTWKPSISKSPRT